MKKQIAIFGGSFNPPHIGHVAICEWLFAKGFAHEVWVVPCFLHPFGKELAPFDDRYKMCLFAFESLMPNLRVLNIEKTLGGTSHTIRTVQYLLEKYPDYIFSLVTGGDVRAQTAEWVGFDKIRELVSVIEIPRGKGSPIPDISATEVRRRIAAGEAYLNLVPPSVAVYLVTHGLYR